jgi:hypothetical protein
MTETLVPTDAIVERMESLWIVPSRRAKRTIELNDSVEAPDVWKQLALEFGAEAAAQAVCWRLIADAERCWIDATLSELELVRIECGLRLVQQVPAIMPTPEQVKQMVCKLPAIFASFRLSAVVARTLDEATLIEDLTWGVQNAPESMARVHCLTGVYHYSRSARKSEAGPLEKALEGFDCELRHLRQSDEELLGEVKHARHQVQGIRRRRKDLPLARPEQFKAYRIEEGERVQYMIERREDQEPSIEIFSATLHDDILSIEYSVLDPAVLTEHAPQIIEETLLNQYAADSYRGQARQVEYYDVDWKQKMGTLPMPSS